MKRILPLILAMLFVILSAEAFADEMQNDSVPEDVRVYAEEKVLPKLKEMYEKELPKMRGGLMIKEDDLDDLKLGKGYRLSILFGSGYNPEKPETMISELDAWLFSINTPKDEMLALFKVRRLDGRLRFEAIEDAGNLAEAFDILKALTEKEGCEYEPKIITHLYTKVVMLSFDGDNRIITVPTDAWELNDDYLLVTHHAQLPTLEEYIEVAGQGSSIMPLLAPHLDEEKATDTPHQTETQNYMSQTDTPHDSEVISETANEAVDTVDKQNEKGTQTLICVLFGAAACAVLILLLFLSLKKGDE